MRYLLLFAIACSSSTPPTETTPPTSTSPVTGPLSETEFKAMHAATTEGPTNTKGQMIELAGSKAYLSLPNGKGAFPGIVVIHEWWGLNANIKHWSDRFAAAGYAALAVDLYGGVVATTPDDALKAMKAV